VTRRLAAATAGVALVAALLAACGGSGSSADAAEVVRAAPEKTAAAGSAKVAMSVTFGGGTLTGEGAIDLRNGVGALSVDLGSLGGSLASGTVEAVLSPEGIYVKLPAGIVPASRPWIKVDLSALASQAGVNVGSLGQLQSADPSQAIQLLEGAVSDMRRVGEESVRGAKTTRYRGTLDLNRAAAEAPGVSSAVSALGTATVPTDVWIDSEGRVRKMTLAIEAGTAQFEMYDFGTAVDLRPPAASEVTDLGALFSPTTTTTIRRR